MTSRVARALGSERVVYAACAASLGIGLFFVFVWAPHPWGWQGFDHYHEIALEVASGRPFPTLEIPWGYAYFLAAFYRAFGVHPRAALVLQAILNATLPLLVFASARAWVDRRTATCAAVLTGICSFNTIYASTESSDALCTVIFMTAVYFLTIGLRHRHLAPFAAAGLLAGIAPQLRPNLILLPILFADFGLWSDRTTRRLGDVTIVLS